MWKTALKLAVFIFLRSKINHVKDDIGNSLGTVKENMALLAESRAFIFKQNFHRELSRLGNSLLGFMFMLLAALCSGLTGLIWLFAIAWGSPDRNIILSIILIVPLTIGIGIYLYLRDSWKKEPLFDKTMMQIHSDWLLFRNGLHNVSEEIEGSDRK
ncbi:MAG: phage holin family protein [Methylotenera sp.]|nr:phage holin family protein [Methylotenera sp.]